MIKYNVDQEILIIFREILNSSISLLRIFIYNQSIQKISAFRFWFRLLWKSSKLPLIFLGFWSVRSVKQIQIANGKKAPLPSPGFLYKHWCETKSESWCFVKWSLKCQVDEMSSWLNGVAPLFWTCVNNNDKWKKEKKSFKSLQGQTNIKRLKQGSLTEGKNLSTIDLLVRTSLD